MLFEAEVKGNQCLFTLFVLSNLCLGLVGCGTTFAGYYVTRESNTFRWDSGSFIVFGVVLVFLAFLGFCSRRSSGALLCYLLSSLVLLAGQVGFTLAIIATPDYVNILGTTQANVVRYCLLGACGLIFLCTVIAWCYRRTLQSARKDFENPDIKGYNPLNKDKGEGQDPFGSKLGLDAVLRRK
jgi:hypothetical protein